MPAVVPGDSPPPVCAFLPTTGDKLRSELASTTAELTAQLQLEQGTREAAVAEAEALRLQLGGIRQQMAKVHHEADSAKETAQEMRARVANLNQNFMQTGEWQWLAVKRRVAAVAAVALTVAVAFCGMAAGAQWCL
jgi:hypothetical protein